MRWALNAIGDGVVLPASLRVAADADVPGRGVWRRRFRGARPTARSTSDAGTAYVDPNDHAITINEIMAANALSAKDDTGAAVPWIELYNPTSGDISLAGYAVTDDFSQPHRAVLPAGAAVPAGGFLVLWCDGRPSVGPAHVAVSLSSAGGSVGLARPDGSFVDRVTYGSQVVDFSGAREPDGSTNWVAAEWHVSPGAANPGGNRAARAGRGGERSARRRSPTPATSAIASSATTSCRPTSCRSPTPASPRCARNPTPGCRRRWSTTAARTVPSA